MGESIAILGDGNGAFASAADLTLRGYRVQMFSPFAEELKPVVDGGGIRLIEGGWEAWAPISLVTCDIDEALRDARILIVVVPVRAFRLFAELLGPRLTADHIVFLNPGHTGSGLYFANMVRQMGISTPLRTCESSTLTYACRRTGPAEVTVFMRAAHLPFAAFPGRYAAEMHQVMAEVYPSLELCSSVLETALLNINAVEHPVMTLCNAGWVEYTHGEFYIYWQGVTPAVGRVIDAVDGERLALAAALGIQTPSFVEIFHDLGYTSDAGLRGGTAYGALQESLPNRKLKGPPSLDHRYVHEDVGHGLVPWSQLAGLAGVPTPTMDCLIHLASVMNGIDYAREGRTLASLGLQGVTLDCLPQFLYQGPA
jgi:opine dehydrogenase